MFNLVGHFRRASRPRPLLWLLLLSFTISLAALAETRFAQLTDPHLFDRPPEERAENEAGLQWCIDEINQRVAAGVRYDFVILTGDLGLEKLKDQEMIDKAARELGVFIQNSKVDRWFFVPGNNDLLSEVPKTITLYRQFMLALAGAGTGKTIVDLSRGDEPSAGMFDLEKSRFIGFDNASFKSNHSAAHAKEFEADQLARIDQVLARLQAPGFESAYVFFHIPDCDDPYLAAMRDARTKTREELAGAPNEYSAWTVTPKVRERWQQVVNDPRVKGLFAGHFHYFNRAAYEWDRSNPALLDGVSPKLYVTPPVAGKYQRGYIPQARGFRDVAIDGGKFARNKIVWRDLPLPEPVKASPVKQP